MLKRALILGVGGQDASFLAEILLEKGYEVHGLYRRTSTGNLLRIEHLKDKITLHQGDICDSGSVYRVLQSVMPDEVYNEADQDNVGWSYTTPGYSMDVTAKAVGNLLEVVSKVSEQKSGNIKVFQPLSATMFGDASAPQNEDTPFNPQSPYAIAKCLTARSKVLTDKGWVRISKIEVGNKVWTHRGRLKRVTKVFERDYNGELIVINAGNGKNSTPKNFQVALTPEHPVLTDRGWVNSSDLHSNDSVSVLASTCKKCGKPIQAYKEFCSRSCKTKRDWNNSGYRGLQLKRMREHGAPQLRTKSAEINRLASVAIHLRNRGPNYQEVYLNLLIQSCCPGFFEFVGDGQFQVGGYFPDWVNKEEKAILEYVGWGQKLPSRIKKMRRKLRVYKKLGYRVLVLEEFRDVEKVKKLVSEFVSSLGSLKFIFAPIRRISKYRLQGKYKKVFNLEVEDDESFIAQGIVVHNCAAYHLCRYYRQFKDVWVSTATMFNHDSPRRTEEYLLHKICNSVVRIAIGKQEYLGLGDLNTRLEIGYAKDYMEGAYQIMQLDEPRDLVLSTGNAWTIRQMVQEAFSLVGILHTEWERYVRYDPTFDRPGIKSTYLCGDSSRAVKAIGWNPSKNITDLIRMLIENNDEY